MTTHFPSPDKLPVNTGWPDPLVKLSGEPVASRDDWFTSRRPELRDLFAHYMYGFSPPPAPIRASVEYVNPNLFDGFATLRHVAIDVLTPRSVERNGMAPPRIRLLLITPNRAGRPSRAFLGLNFCGNHSVVADPGVPICDGWAVSHRPGVVNHRFTQASRGTQVDVWCARTLIERGYALATQYHGDLDADTLNPDDGVQPHYYAPGQTKPGPHEWGTIAVWAWGLSRCLDYLTSLPEIDAKRVAVVGHSRNGKAALLAAALDDRFALAIPSQAGCGGTAPSRGNIGESVLNINKGFPHWFNDTFKAFDGMPARLPFDQHCLAALVAPRPLLFSNAIEDQWANPWGQFEVAQHTDPVYRFLGSPGLDLTTMPTLGSLPDSKLGYFIRPGNHSMAPEDWRAFLHFADRWL